MSCSAKTSPNAPTESNSHPRPTTPSSGSAHNSQFPPRQTFPPPNPAPPPAANSPAQSSPSRPCPRNHSPSSLRPHPPTPPSRPRSHCPPPARSAPPHSCRSILLLVRCKLWTQYRLPALACSRDAAADTDQCLYLPRPTPPPLRPKPAATSASHRKSSHPPETAVSPRRSTR